MSATLVGVVRGLFALGAVDLLGPGSTVEYTINRGFVAITNPATGEYILTTYEPIDIVEAGYVLVQPYGTAPAIAVCSQSPTQLLNSEFQINLINPGGGEGPVAVDVPFGVQVQDVGPN